jgi:hypothetical protein
MTMRDQPVATAGWATRLLAHCLHCRAPMIAPYSSAFDLDRSQIVHGWWCDHCGGMFQTSVNAADLAAA